MAKNHNIPEFKAEWKEGEQGKWGMAIDMDICTGCNACVAACAMENNVPFVGEEDAGYGRGMHWIRIERLWEGKYPEVKTEFQPVMCQQCGSAPCEPVCPVFASVHSQAEKLNVQVYNRCVGTRYCANNCPYVVRTFNWFDYDRPEPLNNQLNPDVTVRQRGVMEKCTFCIQRIHIRRKIRPNRRAAKSSMAKCSPPAPRPARQMQLSSDASTTPKAASANWPNRAAATNCSKT
jgi:Fe-S-cluster-containing dehydrogenase component